MDCEIFNVINVREVQRAKYIAVREVSQQIHRHTESVVYTLLAHCCVFQWHGTKGVFVIASRQRDLSVYLRPVETVGDRLVKI